MRLFETASEFIELDNRRNRNFADTTKESLTKKFNAQLPKRLVVGSSVLDLGSCLGAAGHYALTVGASHYTGVEIQQYYVDTSRELLSKYWTTDKFNVVQQDVEEFLDSCIAQNKKFDYVLASGLIYGFVDVISLIKKICTVSNGIVVIDTLTLPYHNKDENTGLIALTRLGEMIQADSTRVDMYNGIGSRIDRKALDILMSLNSFGKSDDVLTEPFTETKNDPYNSKQHFFIGDKGFQGPARYTVLYRKTNDSVSSVQKNIQSSRKFNESWVFDESVAERFQHEAETNIPSYHTVIDKCLSFAKKHLKKSDKIIDVGSALGYTMNRFIDAGFTDVMGVDNSPAMNSKNKHEVVCSDTLPEHKYKLVLMNWTLHFIQDKHKYLSDIYDKLDNGHLILTDKTSQSDTVKELYYDFKRSKGVSDEYIYQKEKNLVGVMHSVPIDWYLKTLREIGFTVDIIHSDLGFTTFLCSTNQS